MEIYRFQIEYKGTQQILLGSYYQGCLLDQFRLIETKNFQIQ